MQIGWCLYILYVQFIRDSVSATSAKFSFVLLEPGQLKSLNIRILKEVCHCIRKFSYMYHVQVMPHSNM